ncbi:transcription antitermination factor NusB [Alicyclobacillus sp.]|uniref:transcription antitermination factor NusB n=1 Tax=Alicyclobacillus sp. TaxID=61169 RepID=UPI0025C6CCC2|nr:transcription antitermination factor NusB [Alicyclobacillus sp.]MCL6516200.1 transcription antitermination factor NusB [Alicyclobacillus sp.]
MRRHDLRAKAVQAIYQVDVGRSSAAEAVAHVFEEEGEATDDDRAYVRRLVDGVVEQMPEIDRILSERVQGWRLDRIARVDLAVLRLALFELLHEWDVDVATIADEAVELAKQYSTEESGRFVNGVLSRVIPLAQERRAAARP